MYVAGKGLHLTYNFLLASSAWQDTGAPSGRENGSEMGAMGGGPQKGAWVPCPGAFAVLTEFLRPNGVASRH